MRVLPFRVNDSKVTFAALGHRCKSQHSREGCLYQGSPLQTDPY